MFNVNLKLIKKIIVFMTSKKDFDIPFINQDAVHVRSQFREVIFQNLRT